MAAFNADIHEPPDITMKGRDYEYINRKVAKLEADNARLQKDADRFKWVMANTNIAANIILEWVEHKAIEMIDEAIEKSKETI